MPFPELIADLVTYEALYTGNHERVKTGFQPCSYVNSTDGKRRIKGFHSAGV